MLNICVRASDTDERLIPFKCVRRTCSRCGLTVLAKAGKTEEVEKAFPKIQHICTRCAKKLSADGGAAPGGVGGP